MSMTKPQFSLVCPVYIMLGEALKSNFSGLFAILAFAAILLGLTVQVNAADPLLATAAASGTGYQEYDDPSGWWQTISYQLQTSLRLEGYYVGKEGPIEVYQLTRKQGSVRFWGTAEDHFFGAVEVWNFDDQRTFDLNTIEGLLRFLPSEKRVVYVGFGLSEPVIEGIHPYRLRIYATNSPAVVRLYADLPSKWWLGPEFDVSVATNPVSPVVPDFEILDCKMITPGELGIGIRVRYPATQNAIIPRKVLIETVINGAQVQGEFDISSYTTPGQVWGRVPGQQNTMYDLNGSLLPTTPIRILLSEHGVDRFTNSLSFNVPGIAYCGTGLSSTTAQASAHIPLPVVVLHGYIHPYGYPYPPWQLGPFFPYEVAYKSLKEFMQKAGYDNENNWESYPYQKYRTYWDPRDFNYSDPPDATSAMIESDVSGLLGTVWTHNYARKVDFVGHSFGGLVARRVAATDPSHVNKVVTVGTPHRGATFFYEVAFEHGTKAEADADLVVEHGPAAGQQNILQWTTPTYEALIPEQGGPPVVPPYANTLTTSKGGGVRYYALYSDTNPQTHNQLILRPIGGGWYQNRGTNYSLGDGYILALSASAFADVNYRVNGAHPTLLNEKTTQDRIYALLSEQLTGETSDDSGTFGFSKGSILPGSTVSRTTRVDADIELAEFDLDWPGSTLSLVLRDPTGRVIDSGWTNGVGGVFLDIRTNSCRYAVTQPAVGTWTYEIQAVDVPVSGEDYLAMVHLLKAGAFAEPLAIYRTGQNEAVLVWPASGRSTLEAADSLAPQGNWTAVTNSTETVNGLNTLSVGTSQGRKFYRLVTTVN